MARSMAKLVERLSAVGSAYEAGKWAVLQGAPYVAFFGLSAWAAWAAKYFSEYAPLSWVVAGFIGALAWSLIRLIGAAAFRLRVRTRYDAGFLERGGNFNPLDMTFERKRIYINDFVLPSHPVIENKTFIDCDIIGPANLYFDATTNAAPIRAPKLEGVWLHPSAKFANGFIFNNCLFRNCSFQRITLFASAENFDSWKTNTRPCGLIRWR